MTVHGRLLTRVAITRVAITRVAITRVAITLAALLPGGCDATSPYRAVLREQTTALQELETFLATVKDKDSMRAGRAQLDMRFANFDRIKEHAKNLPLPTPDILQQVQIDGEKLSQALQKVLVQVQRINALPEGPEFLGSFEHMKGFPRGPIP